MPPYDSDASDGDSESEYTETNVLLGYASKDPTDDTFSQLGGQPTWPAHAPTPPSFATTRCGTCNDPMPLLLQLNGDSPQHFPGHTRRLYVFGCRRKACARKESTATTTGTYGTTGTTGTCGAVRAIRAVGVDAALAAAERRRNEEEAARKEERRREEDERRARQAGLGSAVFGGGGGGGGGASGGNPFAANPFAAANGGGGGGGAANPFASPASGLAAKPAQTPTTIKDDEADGSLPATFAEKARIAAAAAPSSSQAPIPAAQQQPYEPWPTDAAQLAKPYPSYHLDADYETLSPDDDDKALPANAELDPHAADPDDAEPRGGGGGGGGGKAAGKQEKQIYESLMDKTFQRFADRLAQNPEQVLRYEWRGEPLLYSRKDGVGRMLAADVDEENDDDDDDDEGEEKVKTVGRAKGMPRCANCGAERVFEVQLTPQAIAELEAEELGLEGMEWGTVIVGVCAKDCAAREAREGEVGYVEEWVGVQWEEVADRK
ncbi:putative 20S rRNA accumulation protein 4 [Diplodia seriata]|uniref:Putative 20S rRNA accumulation protein 4 n=1 Tax=Diplodia seriata TaxID=420778 RepID=A0A1S8B9R6_9PEZI|nr:putative 20S rRNA accumulation protein 4 [Diplodia seriata]